ncbi:MAG: hypothetical protein CMH52_00805 [Myxococcales bacterium]|nr:hypothetical protein [Myxococcales bacterium]
MSLAAQPVCALVFIFSVLLLLDDAYAVGPGIRNGNVVLHPRLSLSAGYDSNFWRESDAEATAPVNPVKVFKFGGGLSLKNRNANRAALTLDLDAMGRYVTADNADETASSLDQAAAMDQARGRLRFSLLPRKPISIDLFARGTYSEQPGVELLKEDGYNRLSASFGPDIRFRPGGRPGNRALELRLGYRFSIDRTLATSTALGSNRGDKNTQELQLLTHWKFFPKTALFIDVRYWMVDYRQGVDLDQDGNPIDGPNRDLNPLRAELGIQGLLTRRLSLTLRGGYSNSFHDAGDSYGGPIARADIEYRFEPRLVLGMGYAFKLGDDAFSNYYTLQRGNIRFRVNIPGRVFISGRAGIDYYKYSRDGAPSWTALLPDRTEPIFLGRGEFGWEPVDWFKLSAAWTFENNRSKYYYCLGENPGNCFAGDPIDLAEYTRHTVMLSATGNY